MSAIEWEKELNRIIAKLDLNGMTCSVYEQNGTPIGILYEVDRPICKDGMILKYLADLNIGVDDLDYDDASFLNYLSQKWNVKDDKENYLFSDLAEAIHTENKKDMLENESILQPLLIDYLTDYEEESEFICIAPEFDWCIIFDAELDENDESNLGLLLYYLSQNLRVSKVISPNQVYVNLLTYQLELPIEQEEAWTLFNNIEDAVINKNEEKCAEIYQTLMNLGEKI